MGLFGFIGDIASAAIKVAATPIAATSDIISVATGNEADATKKLYKSVGKDLEQAADEIMP